MSTAAHYKVPFLTLLYFLFQKTVADQQQRNPDVVGQKFCVQSAASGSLLMHMQMQDTKQDVQRNSKHIYVIICGCSICSLRRFDTQIHR